MAAELNSYLQCSPADSETYPLGGGNWWRLTLIVTSTEAGHSEHACVLDEESETVMLVHEKPHGLLISACNWEHVWASF